VTDEVKIVEFLSCGYRAPCWVKGCTARATTIARASDAYGRPITQYELCAPHAEQIAERERAKGREILRR
jgi:hypothetical protein